MSNVVNSNCPHDHLLLNSDGKCGECSRLMICNVCWNIHVGCESCYRCTMCCSCRACNKCLIKQVDFCRFCGLCKPCCHCRQLFVSHTVNLALYAAQPEQAKLNKLTRLLGAEIEICKSIIKNGMIQSDNPLMEVIQHWRASIVKDGSLPAQGFEITTHPASGDYWVNSITDICKALAENDATVGYEAGCHIHVDCRDINYSTLGRLLILFSAVEAGLFALSTRQRRINRSFCEYAGYTYSNVLLRQISEGGIFSNETCRSIILTLLYGSARPQDISERSGSKSLSKRYRAINVHSYIFRQTLEFRIPPGMTNSTDIINWGILLGSLVEFGKNCSLDTILSTIGNKILITDNKEWENLSPTFLTASLELLLFLAPTTEIRDWVLLTVKYNK